MSLSVANSAASFGTPLGYGLASLPIAAAPQIDAARRPSVVPSWTWTPDPTGSGRHTAQAAKLVAVLSQMPASDPDDPSGSASASALAAPRATTQPLDRAQSQAVSQATPWNDAATDDVSSQDSSSAAAEVKLDALFRTLQAYGL